MSFRTKNLRPQENTVVNKSLNFFLRFANCSFDQICRPKQVKTNATSTLISQQFWYSVQVQVIACVHFQFYLSLRF